MNEIVSAEVEQNVKTPRTRRRWPVLLAVVLIVFVLGWILHVSQQRKEQYIYYFQMPQNEQLAVNVGIADITVTHRWSPVGGVYPKVELHAKTEIDNDEVRYLQFVYRADNDREWNASDPTRRKKDDYWLVLRDIPNNRILSCYVLVVTQSGQKYVSETYVFNTMKEGKQDKEMR